MWHLNSRQAASLERALQASVPLCHNKHAPHRDAGVRLKEGQERRGGRVMAKDMDSGTEMGSNPAPSPPKLCHAEQATSPLNASVSSATKWGQ